MSDFGSRSIAALLVFLVGVSLAACGGANSVRGSPTATSSATAVSSGALSNTPSTRSVPKTAGSQAAIRAEQASFRAFGHPADRADKKLITALVDRYYAAAAIDDGAGACSLLDSAMRKTVPLEYGQPPGPPDLRGKTCAVVMTKMFKRPNTLANPGVIAIVAVRVGTSREGKDIAYAVWRSSSAPWGETSLQREHGSWGIS